MFLLKSVVAGLAVAFVVVYFFPGLLNLPQSPGGGLATSQGVTSFSSAVDAAAPAVVNIYTLRAISPESGNSQAQQPRPQRFGISLGSGVIVDPNGLIVTNDHLIDGFEVFVQLYDDRVARATLVGRDPDTDLALLKVDLVDLPVIRFGRSDILKPGDVVLAIGNPYGLTHTVTQGIVSATGRGQLGVAQFEHFIQTDAAINFGNSGGALINVRGELVGINTARIPSDIVRSVALSELPEGIGFAAPVNLVRGVVDQLATTGRVIRGWVGVTPRDLTRERARSLGLTNTLGIEVSGVRSGSPAFAAGLRPGDIITHLNGQAVGLANEATTIVAEMSPGSVVRIRGLRDGRLFDVETQVVERPVEGS